MHLVFLTFPRYVEDEIVKRSNNRIKKKQIRNIKVTEITTITIDSFSVNLMEF